MNISKSFILIHLLYRETDNENTFSIPASDKELPPYLQQFLPLFVVRFTVMYLSAVLSVFKAMKLNQMTQFHSS